MTVNQPGSAVHAPSPQNWRSAGDSVNVTVRLSPGASSTRSNPLSSWTGRVTRAASSRT